MLRLRNNAVPNWLLLVFVMTTTTPSSVTAFGTPSLCASSRRVTVLQALTERQMQFWEDVEDGLKDIEEFYQKKDQGGIDRIWGFCER